MALKGEYLLLIAIYMVHGILAGQNEELLEEMLSGPLAEDQADTELLDDLWLEGLTLPLNLNRATDEELKKFPWLTPLQIQRLRTYLSENGPLISLFELQAVPGWDQVTLLILEPLVYVQEQGLGYDRRSLPERVTGEKNKYLLWRYTRQLELPLGYDPTRSGTKYLGPPYHLLGRFRFRKQGDFSLGLSSEKDAGEPIYWKPQNRYWGMDFFSAHLMLENKKIIKKIILGDYLVRWDQGLVLHGGFNFFNPVITGIKRVHTGFAPYSGSSETGFFRGLALEIPTGSLIWSFFYSAQNLDAEILQADSEMPKRVSSINDTGLHRTDKELSRRRRLMESVAGIHTEYPFSRGLRLSISGAWKRMGVPLIPKPTRYNEYSYHGNKKVNLSGSVEYNRGNHNIFGQAAWSAGGGKAVLVGWISSFSSQVSMAWHYRNYSRDYHGIADGAFGRQKDNRNEQGFYWGLQFSPHRHWVISSSLDLFKFPWRTREADVPAFEQRRAFRTQYIPNRHTIIDLHWRWNTKHINRSNASGKATHDIVPQSKHFLSLRASWKGKEFSWKSRIQWSGTCDQSGNHHGILVGTELSYSKEVLKTACGISLFGTDDFENRQFSYERDVLYSFSIPFFSGTGTRRYAMLKMRISKNVDFWVKMAQTQYWDRKELGSGPETLEDSKRTTFRTQIVYKL